MLKDISIHRLVCMGFDDLKHCQLPLYDVEKWNSLSPSIANFSSLATFTISF